MKEKPDKQLIQSYVRFGERCFWVSTFDRDSSAISGPERYAETIVWDWDVNEWKSKALLYQRGCCQGRIHQHLAICAELFATGELKPEE